MLGAETAETEHTRELVSVLRRQISEPAKRRQLAISMYGSPASSSSKTPRQRKAEMAKAAHQIRLVSNVFRAAGKLYLHTVVSGCNPDVKEIKDAVSETVTAFEHLEASTTDRSLVFPIALAGCMTDSPAYRSYLVSRLKALGKEGEAVGNTKRYVLFVSRCKWFRSWLGRMLMSAFLRYRFHRPPQHQLPPTHASCVG